MVNGIEDAFASVSDEPFKVCPPPDQLVPAVVADMVKEGADGTGDNTL